METSSVNVINDQSSYAPNEWPEFTETIGSTTRTIPGSFLDAYVTNIQAGFDQFEELYLEQDSNSTSQGTYIKMWNEYNTYFDDIYADIANGLNRAIDMGIVGLGADLNWDAKSYFYAKMNGKYKIVPEPYTGPNFDSDLSFTYGYGSLMAGHLDLTMSYKTFGTLGQGLAADQNTYDSSTTDLGVVASWKGSGT